MQHDIILAHNKGGLLHPHKRKTQHFAKRNSLLTTGLRERGNDTSKSTGAAADRTQRPDATCGGTNG